MNFIQSYGLIWTFAIHTRSKDILIVPDKRGDLLIIFHISPKTYNVGTY